MIDGGQHSFCVGAVRMGSARPDTFMCHARDVVEVGLLVAVAAGWAMFICLFICVTVTDVKLHVVE